jgi:hypothetical protein
LDLTDTKCGLLESLYSSRCIRIQQKQRLEVCKDEFLRNGKLYAILCRKSVGDFNTFIDCLRKTNQHQILSFLALDEVESPLSEEKLDRLVTNHSILVENIYMKHFPLDNIIFQTLYNEASDGVH